MSPVWRSCVFCMLLVASAVQAQSIDKTVGTVVSVSADGEVQKANDRAVVNLLAEEQDQDKAVAASRVNQKMKQAIDLIKRDDPTAILRTRGAYARPVYADQPDAHRAKLPAVIGWRAGQYLELRTANLTALPKVVASVQRLVALNEVSFGLSEQAARSMDDERIRVTYANLTARIAAIARTMGRAPADAVIESLSLEGADQLQQPRMVSGMVRSAAAVTAVEEPSFEAGETTLQLHMVAKLRMR